MKLAEVKVGEVYYTRIGEELAPVIVIEAVYDVDHYTKRHTAKFRIARAKKNTVGEWMREGDALPKHRTAAALRIQNRKMF